MALSDHLATMSFYSTDQVCLGRCKLADYNYRYHSKIRQEHQETLAQQSLWSLSLDLLPNVSQTLLVLARPKDNLCFRVLLRFQRQGVHHGQNRLPSSRHLHVEVYKSSFYSRNPSRNAAFNCRKFSVEQVGFPGRPCQRVCPQK